MNKRIGSVIILLVLVISQARVIGQSRDEIIKEAVQNYDSGRFVEAYYLLAPLAKENKADEVACLYLGRLAFQGKKSEEAEKCFRKAVLINPNYA